MSSGGARAYGSILNQCTPTVGILRRFNFFFPLPSFAHIDGDAPGFECHEGHSVTNLNSVYSSKEASGEKELRWINGGESCLTIWVRPWLSFSRMVGRLRTLIY